MHCPDTYQIRRGLPTWALAGLFAALVSCGDGSARAVAAPSVSGGASEPEVTASPPGASPRPAPAAPPVTGLGTPLKASGKRLTVAEARAYMIELVNRDRATQKLPPVAAEHGPGEAAAQAHAEDMAKRGFLGHWGTDGSVPESRHTRAGGAHMILENALCVTDEQVRALTASPTIDAADVERAEHMFFDEVPPHDGHRKNILKPKHTHLAVGVALPAPRPNELTTACFVHEFLDDYGTYDALPRAAKPGATVHVEGELRAPAKPVGVGFSRVALPAKLPVAEANRRRSYPVPPPVTMYFAKGFKTAIPVDVQGQHFRLELPLGTEEGEYAVSIWASFDGKKELEMVSLRTIEVRR